MVDLFVVIPPKAEMTYGRWFNVSLTRYYDMLENANPVYGKGNNLFNKFMMSKDRIDQCFDSECHL